MIPLEYINEWSTQAPWSEEAWIEQDLIISRALVDMFSSEQIADRLAFRGGTALHKIHLTPAARYSEDIDLVQIPAEPIGDTLNACRAVLDPWLGKPQRKFKEGRVNLVYRFVSTDTSLIPMRLKVEINTREHFSELGLVQMPFEMESSWFSGSANVTTFVTDELLGSKLRALYQRKKGRDLFDLWYALERGAVDPSRLLTCFHRHLDEGEHTVTRAQFEANLFKKRADTDFQKDIVPLLHPDIGWDIDVAMDAVLNGLIKHLPGEPWKGAGDGETDPATVTAVASPQEPVEV